MKKNREIFCGGLSLAFAGTFFMCCLKIPALSEFISARGNVNMLVYAGTLVLFCVVFVLSMLLTGHFCSGDMELLEKPAVKKGILWLLLIGQGIFFIVMGARETDQAAGVSYKYVWHTQSYWLMAILFILETAVVFRLYRKWETKEKEDGWMVWAVYAVLFVLVVYAMDTPNLYGRGEDTDVFHGHAYFNSIYNVHWGRPYTDEITSIYGHYALFWKLPMKLIGGDFRKFVFLMALLGGVIHLCGFLSLHLMVKNRLLRILGALAMAFPILGMRGGYYWQVWPHRMIFPAVMLLYTVWTLKKGKTGPFAAAAGYGICLLAVIWNTETGMILAVSWAALRICRILCREDFSWKKLLCGIFLNGAAVVLAFFGAFGTVNLYNILKHSPVNTISEFLIPLLSKEYMTDVLHMDLPLFPSAYMAEMALLLLGVAAGICGWKWFRKKGQAVPWEICAVFFLCVSALGRMTYYINRPAYHNLDCCHLSIVVLLAWIGQNSLVYLKEHSFLTLMRTSFSEGIRCTVGAACAAAVLAMATGTILQFSQNSAIKENFHNTEEMQNFADQVAAQIPENTFGFGINVPELYSWLHWNTQYYSIDYSDLSVMDNAVQRLTDTLKEQNVERFLTSVMTMPILERNDPENYQWIAEHYTVEKKFSIPGQDFWYYVRNDVPNK